MPGAESGKVGAEATLASATMKLSDATLFCFDLETTGVEIGQDRVVELGAAYSVAGEPGPTFRTLVDPEVPIPPEATEIHGIGDKDVEGAPTWRAVAQRLIHHLAGHYLESVDPWHEGRPVLVGYNAVHFDAPFINAEQERIGQGPLIDPAMVIDPIIWIRWFQRAGYPGPNGKRSRRLGDVCWHFGIDLSRAHSADADAAATLRLLLTLIDRGVLPDSVDELLERQRGFERCLAFEHAEWAHYLYLDRDAWTSFPPEAQIDRLRLGFGKHSGSRLVDQPSYVAFCLQKFGADIPAPARALFEEVVR